MKKSAVFLLVISIAFAFKIEKAKGFGEDKPIIKPVPIKIIKPVPMTVIYPYVDKKKTKQLNSMIEINDDNTNTTPKFNIKQEKVHFKNTQQKKVLDLENR
jgi:hypothetical protein